MGRNQFLIVARQRGVTLLEMVVAMAIGLLLLGIASAGYARYQTFTQNQNTAEWLNAFNAASKQWMRDNYASLVASSGGTATQSQLASGGYFSGSLSATSPYGQTAYFKVVKSGAALQGLVCASGGTPPSGIDQRRIAKMVGISGAYVLATSPANYQGPSINPSPLSAFGIASGGCNLVVASFVSDQSSQDDALHRTAHPENVALNTMQTNILMNGNAIQGASDIKMNAANQGITFFGGGEHIVGSSDFGISFQTNNGQERMRLYNDGHLGLNGYMTLPGGQSLSVGGSYLYGDTTNMALRPGANGGTVYIQGASGGGGTAHLSVAGNITGNEVYSNSWFRVNGGANGIYWQQFGGGWYMADSAWLRAYNDKGIYTGGQMQAGSMQSNSTITAASTITAGSRVTANEFLLAQGGANIGWGCAPNGLLGRDAGASQVVQCKNGVWSTIGGYSSFQLVKGGQSFGMGSSVATCPGGWTMLSGGGIISSNPYATLPGFQSFPNPPTSFAASSTDSRVGVIAYAICAA